MYPKEQSKEVSEDILEILSGEISAVDAYKQALAQVDNDREEIRLDQFRDDHEEAMDYWKSQATNQGVKLKKDAGVWGSMVKGVVKTAQIFGNRGTLQAMRKGEEYGLKNYQKLLRNKKLTKNQRSKIRQVFIPTQKRHIEIIDKFLT